MQIANVDDQGFLLDLNDWNESLDEELALKLAKRWINEFSQKGKEYKIVGVDKYYSVFN